MSENFLTNPQTSALGKSLGSMPLKNVEKILEKNEPHDHVPFFQVINFNESYLFNEVIFPLGKKNTKSWGSH